MGGFRRHEWGGLRGLLEVFLYAPFVKYTVDHVIWGGHYFIHRENGGTLGMVSELFIPSRSPVKGDIPNEYPLGKVYMGLL